MADLGLPVIDADACSLGRLACATCASCVAVCPTGALGLDDDALTLTDRLCTGCGACVAVCPQRAVVIPGKLPLLPVAPARDGGVVLVCPKKAGVSPCLNGLGLFGLAQLWLDGVRRIALAVDACESCPLGPLQTFSRDLQTLNALLADRGLALFVADPATPRDRLRLPMLGAEEDRPEPGRRAFLRAFTAELAPEGQTLSSLARLQAHSGPGGTPRHAFSPRFLPQSCTGCMACIRACPQTSLSLVKADTGEAAYHADPSLCSGCGICMDVCDEKAIDILCLAPAQPDIALDSYRCRGCGIDAVLPSGHLRADGLCPVCATTGHHRKLHQVIV